MKVLQILLAAMLVTTLVNAGHQGIDLEKARLDANRNAHLVPPQIADLFGNERINLYLEDGVIGMVTQKAKILELREGVVDNPTVEAYADSDTIKLLISEKLSFTKALKTGKLKYNAVSIGAKLKLFLVDALSSIYSGLTGKAVDIPLIKR